VRRRVGKLDIDRLDLLLRALEAAGEQLTALLATTDGQILTSLPGVASVRAAAFAEHSLPIARFPTSE
jgi:transposase